MGGRLTIQDIAKRAGVGTATVSRVLNGGQNVSEEAREKVLRSTRELGYRPSLMARNLRTQRSHVIGFISDQIATTPFAGRTIEGAQVAAWEQERMLFVVNTEKDLRLEEKVIQNMLDRHVEGVIYASMYHRRVNVPEILRAIPTVLLNCYCSDRSYSSVVPDESGAAYEATTLLINEGHRRIGLINMRGEDAGRLRIQGYQSALKDHGVPFDPALIRAGNWNADEGYTNARAIMELDRPPTALFCANDRTAMGAYDALRDLGLHVPDDVAVIGFDNQEVIARYLRPALSTMALPHLEMGRWAVQTLLDHADSTEATEYAPIQTVLPCPYVSRDSV